MAIEFQLAKAILADHRAYLHDATGQRDCPDLDQVRVCHRIVTGKSTEGLPTAQENRVLGYSRPEKNLAANVLVEDEASGAELVPVTQGDLPVVVEPVPDAPVAPKSTPAAAKPAAKPKAAKPTKKPR